jgi:hypothetical protein
MKTKDEIIALLKKHKKETSERFAVQTLGLFESYARGAANAASDVDIVVEFDEPTFDHYMDSVRSGLFFLISFRMVHSDAKWCIIIPWVQLKKRSARASPSLLRWPSG